MSQPSEDSGSLPLPASPSKPDSLQPPRTSDRAADIGGIPFSSDSGVAAAAADADAQRDAAGVRPAAGTGGRSGSEANAPQRSPSVGLSTTAPVKSAAAEPPGSDDGLLDSIGKAIAAPITGAADDEQPPGRPGKSHTSSGG